MQRIPAVLLLSLLALPTSASRHRAVHSPGSALRPITHVFVVVLENGDADLALAQPFMQRLARAGAVLANYHGVAHPSQPNYIAMTSGSTYGIADDETVTVDARHIGDLLEARGLGWKAYAENYPGYCDLDAAGDGSGLYVRRHVPFLNFTNIQQDYARCAAHVVNARDLYADIDAHALPAYALYVPNDDDNGHDTGVAYADRWLEMQFGPLLRDPRFTDGLLFVVTFDENRSASGNRVATILVGPNVRAGAVSDRFYDHYSLLRTIESILGTGTLGMNDDRAVPIDDVMRWPDSKGGAPASSIR